LEGDIKDDGLSAHSAKENIYAKEKRNILINISA
jgi:hypothetical protein